MVLGSSCSTRRWDKSRGVLPSRFLLLKIDWDCDLSHMVFVLLAFDIPLPYASDHVL